MRRLIAAVLVLGITSPAVADIRGSLNREGALAGQQAALAAAAQARPNANGTSGDNPYFIPAMVLLGAGGVVTLYGLTHDTGVSCSTNSAVTSVSCGTTKSKATIFTGLGMVGVGGYLFSKGKQRRSSPQILTGPRAIGVGQRLVW
ncbi:MAG: hypothetical protein ABMA15_13455 [Vicinamibacterales bacterium]